jgi:hypothetical protein
MTRETKEIVSGTHTIVAYTFITPPEAEELQKLLFAGVSVEAPEAGQIAERPRIPMQNAAAYDSAVMRKIIVSVDGNTDPFAVINEMPNDEYVPIVAAVKEALPRIFLTKGKKLDTPSSSSTS